MCLWIKRSNVFTTTLVNEIGRQLSAKLSLPDLNIGTTFATFQSVGIFPRDKVKLKKFVSGRANSIAHSLSILGGILSGSDALLTSIDVN